MPELQQPVNLQIVSPLSSIPRLIKSFAVDPAEVLAAAGLKGNALDDPTGTIPYAMVGPLLEISAEMTRSPQFALEVGKEIRTTSLGLVGALMRNAPTLGTALLDLATHQHRNAHGSVVYLHETKHEAFLGYAVYEPGIQGYAFICDCVAMCGLSLIRELLGAESMIHVQVFLSRSEPQDHGSYRRAFGVPIHFDADQTAICFPIRALDRPILGADPLLRQAIEERINAVWHAGTLDPLTRLRRTIRVGILEGDVSAEHIARKLGISRRSLHRHLAAFDLRFHDILDETRCGFAQQLLVNTRLSISDISGIVGFADPSILTRNFTRWTGLTPSKWRDLYQAQPSSK